MSTCRIFYRRPPCRACQKSFENTHIYTLSPFIGHLYDYWDVQYDRTVRLGVYDSSLKTKTK